MIPLYWFTLSAMNFYIRHERQSFIGISKQKIRCPAASEYEIRGVWTADETLSRVFDISSQLKQKLRSKRIKKSSKYMLIKTGYPNLLHGSNFHCLNLTNYLWVWEVEVMLIFIIFFSGSTARGYRKLSSGICFETSTSLFPHGVPEPT